LGVHNSRIHAIWPFHLWTWHLIPLGPSFHHVPLVVTREEAIRRNALHYLVGNMFHVQPLEDIHKLQSPCYVPYALKMCSE